MIKRYINKTIILLSILLVMVTIITSCSNKKASENTGNAHSPRVEIEMQDGGKMVLELYPEFAPETVENFINLSKSGFYDGLKFHRIVKEFMIQGGDPNGDGTGSSDKNIKGEFAQNGFSQNTLKHTRGVISMARSAKPDSASCQFFITHGDAHFLDGQYAAFGKLIEGEEILDRIANTPVDKHPYLDEMSVPREEVVIKKVVVIDDNKK